MSISISTIQLSPAHFEIPAFSFRNLPGPDGKVKRCFAVIAVSEFPLKLLEWDEVNPRQASGTGKVPTELRRSLNEDPEFFYLNNRGITVAAEDVDFDNSTNVVTVSLTDPAVHGIADGLHTAMNTLDEFHNNDGEFIEEPYLTVEFVVDLPPERSSEFARARNTSRQVAEKSVADHEGLFEPLQDALKSQSIDVDLISWKENDGGKYDVRDIVAQLMMFDLTTYDDTNHPIIAYSSKAKALKAFTDDPKLMTPILPLAGDIIRIPDQIRHFMPDQHNKSGGKFGAISGIRTHKKKPAVLPWTGLSAKFDTPDGYVSPIQAASRCMAVKSKDGLLRWADGVSPSKLIAEGLSAEVFRSAVQPTINQIHNPTTVGKSVGVWSSAYMRVENTYLKLP
jgi:hypothetical protein